MRTKSLAQIIRELQSFLWGMLVWNTKILLFIQSIRQGTSRKDSTLNNLTDTFHHLWDRLRPPIVEMDRKIMRQKAKVLIMTEIEALVDSLFLEEAGESWIVVLSYLFDFLKYIHWYQLVYFKEFICKRLTKVTLNLRTYMTEVKYLILKF